MPILFVKARDHYYFTCLYLWRYCKK